MPTKVFSQLKFPLISRKTCRATLLTSTRKPYLKLYIPSTINSKKEQIKNGLVSGKLACKSSNPQILRKITLKVTWFKNFTLFRVPEHNSSVHFFILYWVLRACPNCLIWRLCHSPIFSMLLWHRISWQTQ